MLRSNNELWERMPRLTAPVINRITDRLQSSPSHFGTTLEELVFEQVACPCPKVDNYGQIKEGLVLVDSCLTVSGGQAGKAVIPVLLHPSGSRPHAPFKELVINSESSRSKARSRSYPAAVDLDSAD